MMKITYFPLQSYSNDIANPRRLEVALGRPVLSAIIDRDDWQSPSPCVRNRLYSIIDEILLPGLLLF